MLAPAFAIDKMPVAAQIVTLTSNYPVLFIGETALLLESGAALYLGQCAGV